MDPALSMHRPGTVQGKRDVRARDIRFFFAGTRRDKAHTEGYLLPKKFLRPFIMLLLASRHARISRL